MQISFLGLVSLINVISTLDEGKGGFILFPMVFI